MTIKLFQELNEDGYLEGLEIDKDFILEQVGLGIIQNGVFRWADINVQNAEGCYDIATKCVRYQEYAGEMLSRTLKRRKDAEADSEGVLNKAITANKGAKITEAKALAKGSDEYIIISKRISALGAWEEYLKGFVDILEKYHYLAKKKLDEIYQNQRKSM